jgi:hypothetical protein
VAARVADERSDMSQNNDVARLRAAQKKLNKLPKNASEKDYKRANDAVLGAEKNVSWWKR